MIRLKRKKTGAFTFEEDVALIEAVRRQLNLDGTLGLTAGVLLLL
jgi:hypothetical protein